MEEAADELASELELLGAMYSEDELKVDNDGTAATIVVMLRPQAGDLHNQRFVEVTLELAVSIANGYPNSPPRAKVLRARGLVDNEEAELLALVMARARECAAEGEAALYSMLECAVEELTRLNGSGVCPICRDGLFDDGEPCFLSSCYHSFHIECLSHWYHSAAKDNGKGSSKPGGDGGGDGSGGGGGGGGGGVRKVCYWGDSPPSPLGVTG